MTGLDLFIEAFQPDGPGRDLSRDEAALVERARVRLARYMNEDSDGFGALPYLEAASQLRDAYAQWREQTTAELPTAAITEEVSGFEGLAPAEQLSRTEERIVTHLLYEEVVQGNLGADGITADQLDALKELHDRVVRYKDEPEYEGMSRLQISQAMREALASMRDRISGEIERAAEPEPQMEQYQEVAPHGYGSGWYVLFVEPGGTYIVANKNLVQARGGYDGSARSVVERLRNGRNQKDERGIIYYKNKPLAFEMPWQQLEELCDPGYKSPNDIY